MREVNNNQLSLSRMLTGSDERTLRRLSNESGLLMLEQGFTEQLQALYDEEDTENGGGYYREFIPFFVQQALKGSEKLGVGDEIYKELAQKLKLGAV